MKPHFLGFLVFIGTSFVGFPATSGPNLDVDQSWFRFEEGEEACLDAGCEVIEWLSEDPVATTDAEYSIDVPFTDDPAGGEFVNGEKNTFSLRFEDGTSVRFDPFVYPDTPGFIFHAPEASGSFEATLEWYMKVEQMATESHNAVFWTETLGADAGRYNIHFDSAGVGGDYREAGPPDGQPDPAHLIGRGIVLPFDAWTHIAIVRTVLEDGRHVYTWYVNHVLRSRAPDENPNPPLSLGWTISGRPGRKFPGWVDEVRMTPRALKTDEMLPKTVERPLEEICDNGVDDDGDGDIDDADADCISGVGPFIRGDCDSNGVVGGSPTEAVILLGFAFRGAEAPPCLAACDAEANGTIGVTDALRILRHAFLGLGEPDPPFPNCATSDTESDLALGCEIPPACDV